VLGLPLGGRHLGDGLLALGMPLVIVGAGTSLLAWYYFLRGAAVASALVAVVCAMLLSIGVFSFVQPLLRSLQVSVNLAAATRALACPDPRFATLGYSAPSLVFLVGGEVAILETGAGVAGFLGAGDCRMVFVERRFQAEFLRGLDASSVNPALNTRVRGFSLNERSAVDIGVYLARW